jgi:hypothetical protein
MLITDAGLPFVFFLLRCPPLPRLAATPGAATHRPDHRFIDLDPTPPPMPEQPTAPRPHAASPGQNVQDVISLLRTPLPKSAVVKLLHRPTKSRSRHGTP